MRPAPKIPPLRRWPAVSGILLLINALALAGWEHSQRASQRPLVEARSVPPFIPRQESRAFFHLPPTPVAAKEEHDRDDGQPAAARRLDAIAEKLKRPGITHRFGPPQPVDRTHSTPPYWQVSSLVLQLPLAQIDDLGELLLQLQQENPVWARSCMLEAQPLAQASRKPTQALRAACELLWFSLHHG